MVVANLIILSQCADSGIDLNLKAKGTLTICMLPANLMVVSKIRIKAKIGLIMIFMRSITRTISSLIMNKDSITMVFNTHSLGTKMWCLVKYPSQPSLQQSLTDLYVSDGSNGKTFCFTNGKTFCFKVDTGACGNLLPYNLYKQIAGHKAHMNYLHSTIDNSVNLVAYNNKKIKQLGICTLHVSCGPNMRMVKFFIVDSKLNPIIGPGWLTPTPTCKVQLPLSSILDRTKVY